MTTAEGGGAEPPGELGPAEVGVRIVRGLDRVWAWIEGLSGLAFGVGLLVLVVLRNGVASGGSEGLLAFVRNFPEPIADYRSNSVAGVIVARATGVGTEAQWRLLHAGVIAVAVAVVAWAIASRFDGSAARRTAAIWLSLTAVPAVLLQKVGSYDPFTVIGLTLIVLPRRARVPLAVVGGVLVAGANAEQGLVALACAALLIWALPGGRLGEWRAQLVAGAVAVAVTRVAVVVWLASSDVHVPSRAEVFRPYLGRSVGHAAAAAGSGAFGWYGAAWALVGLVLVMAAASRRMTGVRWLAAAVAAVGLPAAATVTTLDGTRVFAMVSLGAFLVATVWAIDRAGDAWAAPVRRATTALLLVSPLVPVIVTDPTGGLFFVLPFGR